MNAFFAFLTTNKRDVTYALAFVALIWAGWWMRGVYDDHLKLAELEAAQKHLAAANQKINQQATEYERSRAASQTALSTLKQQLRAAHAKEPSRPACPIDMLSLQAINH